ncbi:MAG: hypothetical protein QXG40_06910 [Ignisphaera sp.]
MSLMEKIKVVMDLFSDVAMRLDIAQTITFLFDVYSHGKANEDQIRDDLFDLFLTLANVARPDLLPEERKKIASQLTEDFMNTFKLEGARRRMMSKYRLAVSV